jgi:Ca2+-dependent lipid-binding protein
VPDIIFYFADDFLQDRRHTFYRIKAADILDQPRTPKVIKMKEDRSLALVKDDEFPGFLYANVQLMSVNPGPRKAFQPIQSEKVEYELRVYLFLGRNLPPADSTGTSDPFVKVRCGGQLAQSKTCQQTLNPGWYETLVMNIKLFPLEQPCVVPGGMFVMVFDDDGDGKASLIGRVWITLEPNLIAFQSAPDQPTVDVFYRKPKWYNIIYDATDEVQG